MSGPFICAGCGLTVNVIWASVMPPYLCSKCMALPAAIPPASAVPPASCAPEPADPGPSEEPARLTGKVIGFRCWMLEGHRLSSMGGEWEIGVNEAQCRREVYEPFPFQHEAPSHRAPAHHCTCGLHAWYDRQSVTPGTLSVYGAVLAWGHIEAQPTGFRAQYAQPVILAYHPSQSYEHVRAVQAIASEMDVACVEIEQLAAEALKLGQPVPSDLRPPMALRDLGAPTIAGWNTAIGFSSLPYHTQVSNNNIAPPPPSAPPARRRSRSPIGAVSVLPAAAANYMFFALDGHWISLSAAVIATAIGTFLALPT